MIANWKMNSDREHAVDWCREVSTWLPPTASAAGSTTEVWLAPPSLLIPVVSEFVCNTAIVLGSQNVHGEPSGAFTGEVSVQMLRQFGCQFALVGHSERRHVFKESDAICASRALGAIGQGLRIVYCVGETLEDRQSGMTTTVIERQLGALCDNLKSSELLLIAYEPVWAIGTGTAASPKEIIEVHTWINAYLAQRYPQGHAVPILYGGSVTPDNAKEIFSTPHVSGALIGKASLSHQNIKAFWQSSQDL